MRILVTSGATREYIDGVRFISNVSTGQTGADLCAELARLGHEVFSLRGESAIMPARVSLSEVFLDFSDLNAKARKILSARRFDLVIHCAAVSDYSIESITCAGKRIKPGRGGKIDSSKSLTLKLRPNFKILDRLPRYAKGRPLIVGFKLTNTPSLQARRRAIEKLTCPLVVHNDWGEMKAGKRIFRVYERRTLVKICQNARALARFLADRVVIYKSLYNSSPRRKPGPSHLDSGFRRNDDFSKLR